jgi:hypothetical protein
MRTLVIIFGTALIFSTSSCATRVAVRPAHTTLVKVAPKHHKIVVVKGKRYYYWNHKYHKKTQKGYVVVKIK